MARQSKRIKHIAKVLEETPSAELPKAVEILKNVESTLPPKIRKCRFDQTVAISVRLGVDPKQADQIVRGSIVLPHGIGKSKETRNEDVIGVADSWGTSLGHSPGQREG